MPEMCPGSRTYLRWDDDVVSTRTHYSGRGQLPDRARCSHCGKVYTLVGSRGTTFPKHSRKAEIERNRET